MKKSDNITLPAHLQKSTLKSQMQVACSLSLSSIISRNQHTYLYHIAESLAFHSLHQNDDTRNN